MIGNQYKGHLTHSLLSQPLISGLCLTCHFLIKVIISLSSLPLSVSLYSVLKGVFSVIILFFRIPFVSKFFSLCESNFGLILAILFLIALNPFSPFKATSCITTIAHFLPTKSATRNTGHLCILTFRLDTIQYINKFL